MVNPDGATEAGSLELDLSAEAGSSCEKSNVFSFGENTAVYLCRLALMMHSHPSTFPKSLLGKFTYTNCQDIYRLVDIEPHPLGSISGFVLAGSGKDVLSHGRGEVRRCRSYLAGGGSEILAHYGCEILDSLRFVILAKYGRHFDLGHFVPQSRPSSCGGRI